MKTKITLLVLALLLLAMLPLTTACQPAEEEDWRIVHPLQDAEKITFSLTRKTDIMDYSPKNPAPEEIVFYLNIHNGSDKTIERISGILMVCDAEGKFLCAINTPEVGTEQNGVSVLEAQDDGWWHMTTQDVSNEVFNQLLCTHPSELKLTFEITSVIFRQYKKQGGYDLVHATEFPSPKTVTNKIEDLDFNSRQEDFRVATQIYMNGGYEQALGLFEDMYSENASKYPWEGKVQLYIDKCREMLGVKE